MNVLVLGGLGHIGSKLIEDLSKDKKINKVIVIDNFLTNRYCSLFNIKKSKLIFKFYDILSFDFKILYQKYNFDLIINLAAITDASSSFKIKNKLFKNNFEITKKITNFIKDTNIKLIFISSTSVYGENSKIVNENSLLIPQSPYAECKIKEENFIKKKIKHKNQYIILRFGTIAGISKGMRFHTAVNKFCFEASFDLPILVWKSALRQYRPYLSLSDASKSILFLLKKNHFNNDTYNVLSENLRPIDIINEIKKHKKRIKVNLTNNKIMNLLSYKVENIKFKKLGFTFSGSIAEEIKNTMNLLN